MTLTLISCVIYKIKFAKKKDPGLQKPDWKKDVVYLCQFYLVPSMLLHVSNYFAIINWNDDMQCLTPQRHLLRNKLMIFVDIVIRDCGVFFSRNSFSVQDKR